MKAYQEASYESIYFYHACHHHMVFSAMDLVAILRLAVHRYRYENI